MPCGAPGYTFSVAPLTSFAESMRRGVDRHDLVVVAVDDQGRHVELLQVLGEVGLRERLDAVDDAP